ncbi:purine nucleoside transporter PunC [Shewanella sp. Isolate8]|uniref:purine nucleoside transporter PunC n=1 Tax=Shewanella sp. Isolate8 TaxID=2908529 RepID=UPI001EFCF46F|nr:purine nucleoside transporter PunC [Shewanella sp. Isolate8]MCG9746529.1 Bcr/CflA family multidrug efflux MFS transporter [Shewanella sp. Isolate8]
MNKIANFSFLIYLALLSMLGFIATDMYLPAFKAIETSLDASATQVASSLTFFLAGLALGQLLYGPLVQAIGKRLSLILGLVLFGGASLAIANSDSIAMFNVARFFQALGACSASVIWQAIVIDRYKANEAQQVFSNIMPLVALSPALAPILGAYLLEWQQWHSIFFILGGLSLLLILATLVWVDREVQLVRAEASGGMGEASQYKAMSEQDEKVGQGQDVARVSYLNMLASPRYLGNVLVFGACSAAFFSYLTLWPIVMEQHGYAAKAIGLSFIPQTVMFIVGGYLSKLFIRRYGAEVSLTWILLLFGACVAGIALVTLCYPSNTIWPLLSIFSVMAAANGACYPIVVNTALQVFKQASAKAAGLQNFLQISIAFGASSLVALWANAGEKAIGVGIVVSAIGVLIGYQVRGYDNWRAVFSAISTPDPAKIALHQEEDSTK